VLALIERLRATGWRAGEAVPPADGASSSQG
jgi:hypothetical protein